MIFARFKGPEKPGVSLTPGKVYFGRPAVDGSETVDFEFFDVTDDSGGTIRVETAKEEFEFLDEVYAVILAPFEDMQAGDVVVLDGMDGNMANVKGFGYQNASGFVVLDRTNLFPGVSVMDLTTGVWEKVRRVDECMWVLVDEQPKIRAPTEFRFAVSGGEVMMEQLAECVEATDEAAGTSGLTKGKLYYVKWALAQEELIGVENDEGSVVAYRADRFKIG